MRIIFAAAGLALLAGSAMAGGAHDHSGGISAPAGDAASFDIVHARITTEGRIATFHMAVSGQAGESRPTPTGALAGSQVFAYVWPTTLDSAVVGFDAGAGILAMVATAHPDFDDTPLYDENRDGDRGNDGDLWHSHWVVLGPDEACGAGALKVIDIPEGTTPLLPATWPGLPLLIDSPGWQPMLSAETIEIAGQCQCPCAAFVRDRRVRRGLWRSEPARSRHPVTFGRRRPPPPAPCRKQSPCPTSPRHSTPPNG
jgi:hypothetical protein